MAQTIAVITARGGSKGLPGKNERLLHGHPLLAWSILAARASVSVDRVICNTDSESLASIARAYQAEVPFLRPAELATDTATDLDVFSHFVDWLSPDDAHGCFIVHLRPTTPFRNPEWIDDALAILRRDPEVSSVRTVAPVNHSPYKMWTVTPDHSRLSPLLTLPGLHEPFNQPRQKLPKVYRHSGQLDVVRASVIASGSMSGSFIAPIQTSSRSAIDIDDMLDFQMAEIQFDELVSSSVRELAAKHAFVHPAKAVD